MFCDRSSCSFSARIYIGFPGDAKVELRRERARAGRNAHVVHVRRAASHVDGLRQHRVGRGAELQLDRAGPRVVLLDAYSGARRSGDIRTDLLAVVRAIEEIGGDCSAARRHGDGKVRLADDVAG